MPFRPLVAPPPPGVQMMRFAQPVGGASAPTPPPPPPPAPAPPGDITPYTDVILQLHFAGANGSTTFTDSSSYGRTVTASVGSPTVSTTKSQFGGTSGRLNSASLIAGAASDWSWMHQTGGIWTLEGWFSFDTFGPRTLFSTSNGTTTNAGVFCAVDTNRKVTLEIYRAVVGTHLVTGLFGGVIPNDAAFHHLAVQWDETATRAPNANLFIDGYHGGALFKSANAPSAAAATAALKLGGFNTTADFAGYMDDVRLSKQLVYSCPFTPRTTAFNDS